MNRLIFLLVLISFFEVRAVDFNKHFADSTLRLDYIFSGTPGNVSISLRDKQKSEHWAGRTVNLDRSKYIGYGDVIVSTLQGDTIYRNSFSSLFNEWLDLGETTPTAMEFTLLTPFPKDSVKVGVNLYDKSHKCISGITHIIDPKDILIKENPKNAVPHKYLHKGSYEGDHIGVAILAEGYTEEEMPIFYKDAQEAVDAIFDHEPFKELKERFDFIAVGTPSATTGVSVPSKGKWSDTPFGSHFSTFYSERYLTSPQVFAMYDALNGIPAQHIIVLANSDVYGGGGIFNSYTLTAAHHNQFRPVVVHEFGHSFGGLADEYFYEQDVMNDTYPTDVEPWEPNITTLVDFGSKWESQLAKNTPIPTPVDKAKKYPIGVYEGGGYSFHGVYRPADYCRMRVNTVDSFCPACQHAMKDLILFYTEQQ